VATKIAPRYDSNPIAAPMHLLKAPNQIHIQLRKHVYVRPKYIGENAVLAML
jgi:hypothetical protein